MDKNNNILIIVCVVLAIVSGISISAYVSCKRQDCGGSVVDQGILNEEKKRSIAERDSLRKLAESSLALAASYEDEIIKLSKKTKGTNEKFIKDVAAWRILPNDQRAAFFATELAKVDTIAEW